METKTAEEIYQWLRVNDIIGARDAVDKRLFIESLEKFQFRAAPLPDDLKKLKNWLLENFAPWLEGNDNEIICDHVQRYFINPISSKLAEQEKEAKEKLMTMVAEAAKWKATAETIHSASNENIEDLIKEKSSLESELQDLRRWKKEATAVMPDFQKIADLLNVPLGQSISDKIIPGIEKLQSELQDWKARCEKSEAVINGFGIKDDYDEEKHLPNDRELRKLIQEWQRLKKND